jgi:DHA2 family multidrug resistance protein
MEEWKPRYNPWLVAVVVAIAAFMEVLDTSIANVALPHIAGNLGASQDQAMWVLTTYLVANAIVLPITGWISSAVGRKRFFMICIALFAASSLLCGLAPSLPILLLARALQGASGGGGFLSAAAARGGLCALWRHCSGRSCFGPHTGRVDHGQLFLALDLSD